MCTRTFRILAIPALAAALAACGTTPTTPPTGATADVVTGDAAVQPDITFGDDAKGDAAPDATTDAPGTDQDTGGTDQDTGGTDQDTGGTDQDVTTPDTDTTGPECTTDDQCTTSALVEPCKVAFCDTAAGKCALKDADEGATCDDGSACTETDVCTAGSCVGVAKSCDDGNPCTDDSCDAATGCVSANNAATCDDGDACTVDDACTEGACTGAAKVCEDNNPCTDVACDKESGCAYTNNTADCEDGNACTAGDKCADGACVAGAEKQCDDANPCTTDACDVATGCSNVAAQDGEACTDDDACTVTEACKAGQCVGGALDCDDKEPCTADTCDKATGCQHANDDAAQCDDGNSCTAVDVCEAGACKGTQGKECNDNNPCTDDSCANNECTFAPNTVPCDDGNACTENDACADSACKAGKPIACDDGNECTTDKCDTVSGTCKFDNNTEACDDENACTTGDVCGDGKCTGAPKKCDDGNSCTADLCDPETGACKAETFADNTGCNDGSVCTQNDKCAAGVCSGDKLTCNDDNPCTDDSCDDKAGCIAKPNTAACSDNDACTTGDACKDGKCAPGATPTKCDDANPCTTDSCDATKGCVHENNTGTCNDDNACTDADLCKDGGCVGVNKSCGDDNLCTDDSCDPKTGCVYKNNTALCTDGSVCTPDDQCKDGKCAGGAPIKCDDGNPCTTDTCDPKTGCKFSAVADGATCDDGNGCTANDACKTGKCTGAGKSCDDGNPCTTDGCADDVCSNTNNTSPCNDGNSCTQDDKCDGKGACAGLNPLKCDDGNPCTDDKCENQKGCVSVNNTAPCEDGQFCTDKDACKDGKCTSGLPKTCDDANVCTNDSCDATGKKCVNSNNLKPCDDGDKCTPSDICFGGKCLAGKATNCNDNNPCTNDSCDKASGKCVNALGTTCKLLTVPAMVPVDHADPLFAFSGTSATVKWATDATASSPGKLTGAASLNFNNGTNFADGSKPVAGDAITTFLVDASAVKGTFLTLAFFSYADVEAAQTHDKRFVEVSADGFNTIAASFQLDNTKNQKAWYMETLDVKALIGKKFQVRFRFDSVDGVANGGKGWFVDEINVYAGPVVAVSAGKAHSEPFDSNVNGWQFSAPVNTSTWAIDATPAAPAPISAPASLNFNNGKDFAGTVSGGALSPVLNLEGATGNVTLLFKEWVDVEVGSAAPSFDRRHIQISGDAFVSMPINELQSNESKVMKGWRWNSVSLNAFKGKKVRVRFVFNSVDATSNAGAGWFIDDLLLDHRPEPALAELVTCGNASAWTLSKVNSTGPNWAVDNTGVAAFSPDCSLNFNAETAPGSKVFNFACLKGQSKVGGTATSPVVTIAKPATVGAKTYLSFMTYVDAETSTSWDKFTVVIKEAVGLNPLVQTITVDKAAALKKWVPSTHEISGFHGKKATISFVFDSGDCTTNTGAGVFVDDVLIRADK